MQFQLLGQVEVVKACKLVVGWFEVDLEWDKYQIKSAFISSVKGGSCKVRFQYKTINLTLNSKENKEVSYN